MKLDIKTIAAIFGILLALMSPLYAWMWSIEKRMSSVEAAQDLVARIQNLEDALLPVLVEYKLQEELKKIQSEDENESPLDTISPAEKNLRETANRWAEDQLKQSG